MNQTRCERDAPETVIGGKWRMRLGTFPAKAVEGTALWAAPYGAQTQTSFLASWFDPGLVKRKGVILSWRIPRASWGYAMCESLWLCAEPGWRRCGSASRIGSEAQGAPVCLLLACVALGSRMK
jgi:hypothetical protein